MDFIENNKDFISAIFEQGAQLIGGFKDASAFFSLIDSVRKGELPAETYAKALVAAVDACRIAFTFMGVSENITKTMGFGISGARYLVDGVAASRDYLKSRKRIKATKEQMDQIEKAKEKGLSDYTKQELNTLQIMLGSANKNASIDKTNQAVHAVSGYVGAAGSLFDFAGVPGVSVVTTGAAVLTNFASDRVAATRKVALRRQYITEHIKDIQKQIKASEEFNYLSERDIKHTLLKFLGAKSGKRSEASIRRMALDSSNILETKTKDLTVNRYRRNALKAMGLTTKSKRSDVMKVMGANSSQAANPIAESNKIYKKQLSRSKDYAPGKWKKLKNYVGKRLNFMTRS